MELSLLSMRTPHYQILKSKTKPPLKVLSLLDIRGSKFLSVYNFPARSVASFIWKPAHFEFGNYGTAWHKAKIMFVKKYTLFFWVLVILGVFKSIWKSACVSVFVSVQIISRLDSQSRFEVFTLFSGCQSGGPRRSSIPQISQLWLMHTP